MSNNPYDPNSNAYGGGNPYGQGSPTGTPQPQPQTQTVPAGTPFVDPYQPRDRQPSYPPAVTRQELEVARQSGSPLARTVSGATAAMGGMSGPAVGAGQGNQGAVVCLVLAALFILGPLGVILALIAAGVVYAAARSSFSKAWAANCFNLLLTYMALALVIWLVDAVSAANLGVSIGGLIRLAFAALFAVSAVAAFKHRFFRYPLQVPALKY